MARKVVITMSDKEYEKIDSAAGVLRASAFIKRAAIDAAIHLTTDYSDEERRGKVPQFRELPPEEKKDE